MADPTPLKVSFQDTDGNAETVDTVLLKMGGTTEKKDAEPFEFELKAAGTGEIVFSKAGHFRYRFKIEVVDAKTTFSVKWHKDGVDAPRMGNIVKVSAADGTNEVGDNLMSFTIGTPREMLLIAGYDYHGLSKYVHLAWTRMHDLAKAKISDDYTVMTVFDMETGRHTTWVRGRGKEKISNHTWKSGWALMSDDPEGVTPPTPVPHSGGDPGSGSISITDVYGYIESVGSDRPGTLSEFSIFSHAWQGGPIMFNTHQAAAYRTVPERDPDDHDGRLKDFDPVNMDTALFKAAFDTSARLQIWGCSATKWMRTIITRCRKAKSDTQDLGTYEELPDLPKGPIIRNPAFDNNRLGAIKFFEEAVYKVTYMRVLATTTGIPVWGAPPGLGSQYMESGVWNWMFIPTMSKQTKHGFTIDNKDYYYASDLKFLKSHMPTWEFNEDDYLKYAP